MNQLSNYFINRERRGRTVRGARGTEKKRKLNQHGNRWQLSNNKHEAPRVPGHFMGNKTYFVSVAFVVVVVAGKLVSEPFLSSVVP